jgi:hypothetical protein
MPSRTLARSRGTNGELPLPFIDLIPSVGAVREPPLPHLKISLTSTLVWNCVRQAEPQTASIEG